MRVLLVLLAAACSTPAPPPKPVVAPVVEVKQDEGPSWVGVRVDTKPVRITQVIKDAPGDKAGLKIGDELLSVNGQTVPTGPAFVERIMGT